MPTGTQADPVETPEPMKMAEALLQSRFTEARNRTIHEYREDLLVWLAGRWQIRDLRWLEDYVWNWSKNAWYENGQDLTRYQPNRGKVENIVRALQSQIRLELSRLPVWVRGDGMAPCGRCVAFDDLIVDVTATAEGEGEYVTVPRDANWLGLSTIPTSFNPDAECPRWMQALQEWSKNDDEWIDLLQRWFGYCLMPHRDYARMLLLHGKVRAGKGTICRTLKRLVGLECFMSVSMEDLSETHGLDGLQQATVLCINEVEQLDNREGDKVVRVLKNILGKDPLTINPKHVRQIRNVTIHAAPMISSNEIPKLPNKARGLSSKMVILPFEVTFEGREQFDLEDVLRGELAGIAKWALQGAIDLEKETNPRKKFPQPKRSQEEMKAFHLVNNPFDHFLEARFLPKKGNFIETKVVRREWVDWIRKNNIRGLHVADNQLAVRIERESSWDLRRDRRPGTGARGLRGLALRKEHDDEV